MSDITKIKVGDVVYNIGSSTPTPTPSTTIANYRWQFVKGTIYPCSYFNATTKSLVEGGQGLYTCMSYTFDGSEKRIRLSGNTGGSLKYLAYIILDENNNTLAQADAVTGQGYKDLELDVPTGAKTIWLNGNNYVSVHLEVGLVDIRSNLQTTDKLLSEFANKISYRESFAWKPMPTGLIAFTFDDSLDDIAEVTNIFIDKGVPCCYGAIPELLNKGISSTAHGEETVCQAMMRGVNAVGCEVLAHGSSASEIVVSSNIDDMNFLYNKFVVNKRKFTDFGFKVRGTVRVGGSGNICNDPRTDVWCKLFFDYGDLYGVAEPYNHARFSGSTTQSYYNAIDTAIAQKKFTPLLFHGADLTELPLMIDYVLEHGGEIVNYAYAYDTYGSTTEEVARDSRISTLEALMESGNEVSY